MPERQLEFDGRAGLVIGAANGIGRAAAEMLHQHGARLVLADNDDESLQQLSSSAAFEDRVRVCHVDVRRKEQVAHAVSTAVDQFGRLDFLCHVAGIYPEASLDSMTEDFWDHTIAVNLKGVFLTVQACSKIMKNAGSGRIAVVASITGPRVALPKLTAYAAAKAGVCGFVRAAALELAPYNVTVNALLPGTVKTQTLFRELGSVTSFDQVASHLPLGRLGQPRDMANALLFLLSDAASYMTGQELVFDGGASIQE